MKELIILDNNDGGINTPRKLFKMINEINIDYNQENFLVFYLDSRNKIINSEILFKGGLNSCLIDVKTLFRKALIHNSNAIIVAHNHPSNNIEPSDEDIEVFEELQKAGKLIQLEVLDSIIFNEKEFYSIDGQLKNSKELK